MGLGRAQRPVYASMRLSDASQEAVEAWARSLGVRYAEPRMHVTTAYTLRPVPVPASYKTRDNAAGLVIPSGGRSIKRFGGKEDGSLVLCVTSPDLQERHRAWTDRGASWDYPDYQPHVTFCDLKHNRGALIDLSAAPVFDEPIVLLPETVESPRPSY